MDIGAICRVCLAHSVRMHAVISSELQELYEKLADCKFFTEDERPTSLCYFCYSLLQRNLCFMQTARQAESVLTQLCSAGVVFTADILSMMDRPVHNYTLTPIETVTIDGAQINTNVKTEISTEVNEENTIETLSEYIKADPEIDETYDSYNVPVGFETDSDDDIPLNNWKTDRSDSKEIVDKELNKHKDKVRDKKIKVEREKRKYRRRSKIDSSEVTLTKEQQIQEVASRATSLNYLNSPYRCTLCYRGFISHVAYLNHEEKHDERSGPHVCDICKMRYKSARLLRTHTRTAHSRYFKCSKCQHLSHTAHQASDHERWHDGHLYECKLCGDNFTKRTSYLTHIRARHPTGHVCRTCGERFVGAHGLRMHVSKTHRHIQAAPESTEPCDRFCSDCSIQFDALDAWKRHVITSTKHIQHTEQTKICPICRKHVGDSISAHMKGHEKQMRPSLPKNLVQPTARLACEQCGQSFVKKAKLTEHVRRVHLGLKYNKNIVCEICGKKCTSNAALKYHQRTHTGERPHGCSACGKRFADSNQLRIHTRTHTGEKPYSCEHCAKRFAQKPALNRHYRVHTGAKPYICELCTKSFSQSNSLKAHVRAVHLKMPTCRRKPNQDGALEKIQELQNSQEHIKIN